MDQLSPLWPCQTLLSVNKQKKRIFKRAYNETKKYNLQQTEQQIFSQIQPCLLQFNLEETEQQIFSQIS